MRDDTPPDGSHARQRLGQMLAEAGIADMPPPSVAFLDADLTGLDLPADFALIVPSAGKPEKRWPVARWRSSQRLSEARGWCR